jgi:outer membrane protein assembly factor BamD (BamD/ComL family)
MIMSGSIGIINQFIGSNFSLLSLMLQSMVSYYYMIVIFHIMGYMIYQYQDELGYERSGIIHEDKPAKTVKQKTLSHIDILLKEGELDEALNLYDEFIKSYPEEKNTKTRYFELLLVTKNTEKLNSFACKYLNHLILSNREDKIPLSYKRVLKVIPKFNPDTAELRFNLAQICHKKGDAKSVIRLINGLHIQHPEFSQLPQAYLMMAEALESLPNMQAQAQKCRNLLQKFKQ